ncbi:MAG: ComEC/Rec2 family competence protein [Candidatus Microthrix sp.]|nr:ComEC/Rec2 family competence protein [Candidatus Microthrix sp.]
MTAAATGWSSALRSQGSDWNPAAVGRATLAAQVGVAPVLAVAGLAVPVASFPANVAAGAPAGLLTGWGMTVGLVAGSLPGPWGWVARLPAVVAAWWVDGVARWSARLPLGRFTPGEILAVFVVAALSWATWLSVGRLRHRRLVLAPLVALVCWAGWPRTVTGGAVPGGCLLADRRRYRPRAASSAARTSPASGAGPETSAPSRDDHRTGKAAPGRDNRLDCDALCRWVVRALDGGRPNRRARSLPTGEPAGGGVPSGYGAEHHVAAGEGTRRGREH